MTDSYQKPYTVLNFNIVIENEISHNVMLIIMKAVHNS